MSHFETMGMKSSSCAQTTCNLFHLNATRVLGTTKSFYNGSNFLHPTETDSTIRKHILCSSD